MGRKKKGVLNQMTTKPEAEKKETLKEEIIEKVSVSKIEEPIEEINVVIPTEKAPEEKFESPVYVDDGEEDGEIGEEDNEDNEYDGDEDEEEVAAPRTLQSLSKAELRWFQRTGQMPK